MEPIIGVGAVLLLAGIIFYNAFVSYRWHQDHRGEELLAESPNWYGIFFYANGNDPRLFVPKRSGGGYTINFGKPAAVFFNALISGFFDRISDSILNIFSGILPSAG